MLDFRSRNGLKACDCPEKEAGQTGCHRVDPWFRGPAHRPGDAAKKHRLGRVLLPSFCFSPSFSGILSPLLGCSADVARPGHSSLSGLIKRSRRFLATLNKSSGPASLLTLPASSSVMLFLEVCEEDNGKVQQRAHCCCGFPGSHFLDLPAICWIPLKAPRLPEEAAC